MKLYTCRAWAELADQGKLVSFDDDCSMYGHEHVNRGGEHDNNRKV